MGREEVDKTIVHPANSNHPRVVLCQCHFEDFSRRLCWLLLARILDVTAPPQTILLDRADEREPHGTKLLTHGHIRVQAISHDEALSLALGPTKRARDVPDTAAALLVASDDLPSSRWFFPRRQASHLTSKNIINHCPFYASKKYVFYV